MREVIRIVKKVIVVDKKTRDKIALTCLDFSTFKTKWEKNTSYEVSFEAYDDGSLNFNLLLLENSILFNGQEYIIKHIAEKYDGTRHGVSITAVHVFYELNYRRQNELKKGTVTYSIEEALSFLFNGIQGYSYQVHGAFNRKNIDDFGNTTITDGISKIRQAFGAYVVYPDNKVCHIYAQSEWIKKGGLPIRYRNNASEMNLDWDSMDIVNRVQVISTAEKPLFVPFYVEDTASISKWGIKESSERFETDKLNHEQAANQAKQKFVLEPNISLSIELVNGLDVKPGEERVIQNLPGSIQTTAQIVAIETAPLITNTVKVTLNNTRKNYLDIDKRRQQEINLLKQEIKTTQISSVKTWVVGTSENEI